MSRLPRVVASIAGLVGLVVGLPALLVTVVGWPLPHGLPELSVIRAALGDGWRPDDRFVLGVLAVVAWVLWAQLVRHLVAEARRQHRARPGRSPAMVAPVVRSGQSRRLAGWLVGGLMLAGPLQTAATASPQLGAVLSFAQAVDPTPSVPHSATVPAASAAEPSYVVHTWAERRDCLWTIAERYLGDPLRYGELAELNADVLQPSGQRLGDDPRRWVYPGMVLRLPPEARGAELTTVAPPAAPDQAMDSPTALPAMAETPPAPSPRATVEVPRDATAAVPATTAARRPASTPATQPSPPVSIAQPAGPDRSASPAAPGPPARLGGGAMLVAQALGLGLPLFAAGGLVRRLNRRRRVQLAQRRPGRDIVRPDPAAEPVERQARAIASDHAADWVDATVRVLGARLREASMPAPTITCVRAGKLGLEILLADPVPEAPPGFVVVDEGFVWRVDPGLELVDLQAEATHQTATTPALVSIGASAEGPLLVDLEALGVLSVEGAPDRVAAFLGGVAVELASAPWAEGVDLRLLDAQPSLGVVEGVSLVDDSPAVVRELSGLAEANQRALGRDHTTLGGRLREPDEPWFPTVVVAGGAGPVAAVVDLAAHAAPGSGVVVVGPGPIPGAPWRLVIVDDGHARLEPLGLVVRAAGAPEPLVTDLAALDGQAIASAASLLASASHDHDVAPIADITAEPAPKRSTKLVRRPHDIWIALLGPVEVTGWAKPIGRRSRYPEVLAYLATHDCPVQGYRLRSKIWVDDEFAPKLFREAMSRLRVHLGREGGHLPPASRGGYGLGERVGCDWCWFQELAAAARSARGSDAIELWREALALVRGEPFGGVCDDTEPFGWAVSELLVADMEIAITEAADTLANLALASNDPDTALWATRQGHLASPQQLSLFDVQMHVARHRLDADALNRALRARRIAEQGLNPTSDVPAETMALYERLLAEIRDSPASAAAHG